MHDERETLRANVKAETARAGEMELRLTGDEARMHQLENRLARETAAMPTAKVPSNSAQQRSPI